MATINVYEQYFRADCIANGVQRHAVAVFLISDSECGTIRYEVAVSFFPHNAPDDFGISYDAYHSRIVYQAQGRRSRKREASLLDNLRAVADELAAEAHATIFWDQPLIEARRG